MKLILSNNQEELCKKFLDLLKNNPLCDDPFSKDVVLTQSFAMHHYLTLHISNHLQISMAMHMFYPKTMVQMLHQFFIEENKHEIHAPLPTSALWEANNLRWILMEVLKKEHPKLEESKCFALACEMASLFDEYLLYRLPMLEKWQGETGKKSLQKTLWQEVCGILPVEKYPHHSQQILTLKNLFDKKMDAALKKKLKKVCPRLFIFGISRSVPLYVDLWESMAKHIDVFVFALDYHCYYYQDYHHRQKKSDEKKEGSRKIDWENSVLGENSIIKENWFIKTLKQKSSHVETIFKQPQKLNFLHAFKRFYLQQPNEQPPTQQPPTEHLAKGQPPLGQSHIGQQLTKQSPAELSPTEPSPLEKFPKQFLERDKKYLSNQDHTLIVKKCSNTLDEVKTMCKTIVDLLANHEKHENHKPSNHQGHASPNTPLNANDILVMAPNIDDYTVAIRDAFQTRGIPFSIADESLQEKNELSDELLELLPLLKKENEWKLSHLCRLAQSEYLSRKWHFPNHRESIGDWLTKARIRFGKSDHPNSLQSGVRRLINGYCMWLDDESFRERSELALKQPQFFFEGDSAEELGNFLEMLSHMQSYEEVSQKHSLKQWCLLIKKIAKTFFELPGDPLLENFFKKINALENQQPDFLEIPWQKISLETFLTVLRQQLEGQKKERDYMTGRITFSSLVPMRAIPFKVVYLLGMGENEFVRTEKKTSSLNLMHEHPMPYDRLRHAEDRQLFLDAFFSAQDYFFISYSEVNKNNATQKNPSTIFLEMINEVGEYLEHGQRGSLHLLEKMTEQSHSYQGEEQGSREIRQADTSFAYQSKGHHQSQPNKDSFSNQLGAFSTSTNAANLAAGKAEGAEKKDSETTTSKTASKIIQAQKLTETKQPTKKIQEAGHTTNKTIDRTTQKHATTEKPNSQFDGRDKATGAHHQSPHQLILKDVSSYFCNAAKDWLKNQDIQTANPLPPQDHFDDLEPLNSFEHNPDGSPAYDNYDKKKIADDQLQSLSFWQEPFIDWLALKDEGCLPHGEIGKREIEEINQQLGKIHSCGLDLFPELKNLRKKKWEDLIFLTSKNSSTSQNASTSQNRATSQNTISLWGSIDHFARADNHHLDSHPAKNIPLIYCHYMKKGNEKNWPTWQALMRWIIHSLFYFHLNGHCKKSYFITPSFFLTLDEKLDDGNPTWGHSRLDSRDGGLKNDKDSKFTNNKFASWELDNQLDRTPSNKKFSGEKSDSEKLKRRSNNLETPSLKELLKTYVIAFLESNNLLESQQQESQQHFLPLLPKTSAFLLQQKITKKWDEEKAKEEWNEEINKSNLLQMCYKNLLDDKKNKQREWECVLQTYEKFLMPLEKNLTYEEYPPVKKTSAKK